MKSARSAKSPSPTRREGEVSRARHGLGMGISAIKLLQMALGFLRFRLGQERIFQVKPMRWIVNNVVYSRSELDQLRRKQKYSREAPRDGKNRSLFLVKIIKRYVDSDAKVLEIGCGAGRNLNYLFRAGFDNLAGVDINEEAVQSLHRAYPEMARHAKICNAPIEAVIREFGDNEFDVVYTMAVLQHIHPSSEWIFPEMVRITKGLLVVIEDDSVRGFGGYPRDYKEVFGSLGMEQIEKIGCVYADGFHSKYIARIMRRKGLL